MDGLGNYDFTEMRKLAAAVQEAGIKNRLTRIYDGLKLIIYKDNKEIDDAVIHFGSYGHEKGLLETYHLSDCAGCETAEEILNGWKKMLEEEGE